MSDDTSLAFQQPLARAEATAGGDPLDRISVRDYVKDVEIGAFQSERGVTQRLRFNVVLEVAHHTAAAEDDVDKVFSYDTITDAIDAELATERMNLLETLAEHVAERCLEDRRAVRVFVRIEKLDRIPGALGVEIMRKRVSTDEKVIQPVEKARTIVEQDHQPVVVFLPTDIMASDRLTEWLDAIDALEHPAIIALEPIAQALPDVIVPIQRRISLLLIEQNAWLLASKDDRCVVVETRTELDWAAKQGQMSVWAPSKIVLDAVHRPSFDGRHPRRLAHWFAGEIGATGLIEIGPVRALGGDKPEVAFVDPAAPDSLRDVTLGQ